MVKSKSYGLPESRRSVCLPPRASSAREVDVELRAAHVPLLEEHDRRDPLGPEALLEAILEVEALGLVREPAQVRLVAPGVDGIAELPEPLRLVDAQPHEAVRAEQV